MIQTHDDKQVSGRDVCNVPDKQIIGWDVCSIPCSLISQKVITLLEQIFLF